MYFYRINRLYAMGMPKSYRFRAYTWGKPYKCITRFKRQDVRAGGVATTLATPHLLVKLDKQNMAKTSFKLAASESCGDVCVTD
jgi:hypothetical protein